MDRWNRMNDLISTHMHSPLTDCRANPTVTLSISERQDQKPPLEILGEYSHGTRKELSI